MRVFAGLQLVVPGIAVNAEPVAEDVAERRRLLVAARQPETGAVGGNGRVEIDLALFGELGGHSRGDALRDRRPAEDGLRRHPLARAFEGFAIAMKKGDAAIFDDAD